MKYRLLFLTICLASYAGGLAQSDKYEKAMMAKISAIEQSSRPDDWQDLANSFERIAEAEKTQWLPYYYAALSHVMKGYMLGNGQMGGIADQTDPEADKAEALLAKAEAMTKGNSDISCVRKMIATLRMMADPMSRWQTYGPLAAEALANAKTLDPNNPRVYLLEGQDKFYTPEQFGGSKSEAKLLFEESIRKFESQKPESSLHPSWGLTQAKYFLEQCK